MSTNKHSALAPRTLLRPLLLIAAVALTPACDSASEGSDAEPSLRPDGWTDATHGADAAPDYDRLFNDEVGQMRVHRIDLVIDSSTYDSTMADLESMFGACGRGGGPGGPSAASDPIWVPIDVRYDGIEWTRVGMRYKGNSSLQGAWRECTRKLAFRLDFDQFEDENPAIHDQRFFGFKKMTFSNGYKDDSLIRDKVGADIFRRAGIPAARGAFVQVYATIGDAEPEYFGLYTMVEDPSNRLLDTQFDDDSGNLYKPESQWSAGLSGTNLATEFEKKTNEQEADWSDIESVLATLHDGTRIGDPAAWRSALEAKLDVPGFIRWAAVNQAMVNWDTYGCMAHNYYLYADPSDPTEAAPSGRLRWFPWDLNESLLVGGRCNFSGAEELIPGSNVFGAEWPLLSYILGDAVYAELYRSELAAAVAPGGGVDAEWLGERIGAYHELISPYVVGPMESEQDGYTFLSSESAFESSADQLRLFVENRRDLVNAVLNQ